MIIEQHYDDEVLVAFLHDEPAARRDPHLSDCRPCRNTLQTLRGLSEAMQCDAVWETRELDETPRQSTIDFLRAKQAEMVRENAEAALRVKQLLSQPRETWAATLEAHSEWRTGGMVRALVAEAERSVTTEPASALELGRLAVEIAPTVADSPLLSVAALREWGFALLCTGNHRAALSATEKAEAIVSQVGAAELDSARVTLLRALIVCDFGSHDESRRLARAAAAIFMNHADWPRYVSARRVEGIALYHLRRHSDALVVYEGVSDLCKKFDPVSLPGLLQNIALCHRELGSFDLAMSFFLRAHDSYQRLGQAAAIAKNRWYIGKVLLLQAQYEQALEVLSDVREACEGLGMLHDAALITIDMAQALSVVGTPDRVIELSRSAARYFEAAGLAESEGALTALALIREAAASGRLTAELIEEARIRAQRKPKLQLAFARPAADS